MIVHKAWVGVWCSLAICAGFSSSPARAQAPKPPEAPTTLQLSAAVDPALSSFLAKQHDALGRACEPKQVATLRDLHLIACGPAGLWVIHGPGPDYTLVTTQDLGGAAHSFFVHDNHVWVELTTRRAIDVGIAETVLPAGATPLVTAPVAPPPTAAPPPPPAPADRRIRVTEKREDGVIIEASEVGVLAEGQHIAFYPEVKTEAPDDVLRRLSLRGRPLAIGRVDRVAGLRGRIWLGLNEEVPVGTHGEETGAPTTDSTFAPPRAAGLWHAGFVLRPLLVMDELGAGVFADVRVGYRFEVPFHVEAVLSPVAFASAKPGLAVPFGGFVSASFDTRLFEVGLGIGGQTVNDPDFGLDRGTGTLIAQRLRIGAVDGAHIEGFSYVVLFHSEFEFSSVRVEGQIPVGTRFWLLAAGGGGTLGLGYGEAGLRTLLSGNGLAGSFFLTVTVGGVHIFESCNAIVQGCTEIGYTGPMLGVGGEWRL